MSHIYFLIGLSLQIPNSRLRIVLKGSSYVGTVIEGDFKVYLFGKVYESAIYTDDIRKIDLLGEQTKEICSIINALEKEDGTRPYNFIPADFSTSRRALESWNSVDIELFASTDNRTKCIDLLQAMEFNDIFPVCDFKTFSRFLSFLSTGDRGLLRDYPAYFYNGVLKNNSRVYEGLSMFGPKCPSISTGDKKSTTFILPKPGKKDPNTVVNAETGKRALQYIPVWSVSTGQAAVQWNLVIGSGKLCFPAPRKGKKEFTNTKDMLFSVSEGREFEDTYLVLKGMVNHNKSESGEKKKRKQERGEPKSVKKHKGVGESDEI